MRTLILILACIVINASLLTCSKSIDGSSEDSYKESLEEMKNSLDESQEKKLEEALTVITFNSIDFSNVLNSNVDGEQMGKELMKKLDGKTYEQIIEEGEEIKKEIEKKKKDQAKVEIEELRLTKKNAEEDKINLSKFEVLKSRFYKKKSGTYYVTYEPIIEITVKNGTEKAVSRAYFTGTLSSPERSIPWLKDDFNYEISGGLEPGEETTWYLAPNMFSDWGEVKAPKDAILTVAVNRIDGADAESIYDANQFGDSEEERLNALLEAYPEFRE